MPRGGYRTGSGRKVGAQTKRTIEIVAKAAAEGMSPVEVGLNEMKFWTKTANSLDEPFEDALNAMRTDLKGGIINQDAFGALRELRALRQMPIICAQWLAPYFHPRMGVLAVYEPVNSMPMQRSDK